jgi:hypothetical protein
VIRGDEKEPVTIRLQEWAVVTGRLVDAEGKPLGGIRMQWRYPSLPAPGMRPAAPAPTSDADGRFRLEGLLPGPAFRITLSDSTRKGTGLSAAALRGMSLKPGEVRDLGDIPVKAAPARDQDRED